ncbi:MAG: ATP-dependent protease subunit HslV [Armatimonadota bacterium]
MNNDGQPEIRSTTIVAVRRGEQLALAGDGQVTIDDNIFKNSAVKLRRMYDDRVLAGYAGSAADALALFERLEGKIDEYSGNLPRACLELVKQWRTDKLLRQLQALLIVGDAENLLLISGTGDLLVPDEDVIAIGSGGPMANAAATALLKHTDLPAEEIAREAVRIASTLCIYTNDQISTEVLS